MMRSLFVLALVMWPLAAHAEPSSDLKARAKAYVADGLEAQDDGRYDDAIALYQQGYALIPHPEILFNLGQANRLKGDAARALAYYRRYLAIEPRGRVAHDAERWIAQLDPIVDDDQEVDLDAAPAAGAGAEPDAPAAPAPRRPGRTLRLAGLATGVAGGVSLAVGIKYGVDARRISDDLSEHDGPWTDALLAHQADGRAANRRLLIFAGVGAAAVIGGASLYVLGSRMSAAPVVTERGAGVAVAGRF